MLLGAGEVSAPGAEGQPKRVGVPLHAAGRARDAVGRGTARPARSLPVETALPDLHYNGYVLSKFRRMEQDLRTHGEVRNKHAMHLIRLLLSGIVALREGALPVRVIEHREQLLAIKHGELPWAEVNAWRLALHQEFDAAYAATALPEQPDSAAVDAFLIRARRSMVEV